MMTAAKLAEHEAARIKHEWQKASPKDSGNMARNAIRYERVDRNTYHVYLDTKIAPYAKYTEMPWSETSPLIWRSVKHPEWNGRHHSFLYNHDGWDPTSPKNNPNAFWTRDFIDEQIKYYKNNYRAVIGREAKE